MCRRRSRGSSANWHPAGSPSVLSCRTPACGHLACASAAPRDRAGRASSSSPPRLRASAADAADGNQSAVAQPPVPAAACANRHHLVATDGSGNLRLHADEPAGPTLRIALVLDRPGHGGPPRPRRQKFFPSISRKVKTSSIASASKRFSLPFSSSRLFSRFASDTSMPPYFERHL